MKRWFVVYSKPRNEERAAQQLENQGFEVFLPRLAYRKRVSGRWKSVVEPMFSRYLFLHVDPDQDSIGPVRSTLGVSGLVRFGGELCEVPEQVITDLLDRQEEGTRLIRLENPELSPGDEVELVDGPFTGMRAIFNASSGEDRALILLDMLGKLNTCSVDLNHLQPVN